MEASSVGVVKEFTLSIDELIESGIPPREAVLTALAAYGIEPDSEFGLSVFRVFGASPSSSADNQ